MASAEEVSNTLTLVNQYWPDFATTAADLTNPTPEFVQNFFRTFLAEVGNRLREITPGHNEPVFTEGATVNLAALLRNLNFVLSELGFSKVTLNDLIRPKPKRTVRLMKLVMHFLAFINNSSEEMVDNARGVLGMSQKLDEVKQMNREAFAEIQNLSESVGKCQSEKEQLLAQSGVINKRYDRMKHERKMKESHFQGRHDTLECLKKERSNLQGALEGEERQVRRLQGLVVTETELNNLRDSERLLENQIVELKDAGVNLGDTACLENDEVRHLEKCANALSALSCSELVTAVDDLVTRANEENLIAIKKKTLIDSLNHVKDLQESQVEMFEQFKIDMNGKLMKNDKQLKQVLARSEKLKLTLDNFTKKNKLAQLEAEKLLKDCAKAEEAIAQLENAHRSLKDEFMKTYQDILKNDSDGVETCTRFFQKLLDFDGSNGGK